MYYKNINNIEKWVNTHWGTTITIKNHQIRLHNWKTFKNYENEQEYAAKA